MAVPLPLSIGTHAAADWWGENRGTIRASWSTAVVDNTSNHGQPHSGGLVGNNADDDASIIASYAAGNVDSFAQTSANTHCLVGRNSEGTTATTGTVTNSYWDSTLCGRSGGGEGKTTSQLQTPTEYGTHRHLLRLERER